MNERDAELQDLQVHRRTMSFVRGFVTCSNCGCNYHSRTQAPTFCQAYSRSVDPSDHESNVATAEACEQWIPMGLDRNRVVHPNLRHPYED